jgi:putative ABC transport system substrate-binding protein
MSAPVQRRQFIALLGGAWISFSCGARAQQPDRKVPRIGVLWHAGNAEEERIPLGALLEGLRQAGYVHGQNIIVENRFPNEQPERFQSLAVELADLKVDIMVTVTRQAALAAKRATTTIPIVFLAVPDPLESKLVESLARPGGNITGYSSMSVELVPKRIELLNQAVSGLSRIALVVNANYEDGARRNFEAAQRAASHLGITVQLVGVRSVGDFEPAFASMSRSDVQGVVLTQDGLFYANMGRVAQLALEHRLPMIVYAKEMSEAGALMSYGQNLPAYFRRAANYIDKILKGAKPADLPVEQPTMFDFFINEKTAKSLGVNIPPTLLALVGSTGE